MSSPEPQEGAVPAVSDPLATCPPELRDRYASRAKRASKSLRASVDLKCLECCAWSAVEVKRCRVMSCALWPRRPFQAKQREGGDDEQSWH